VTSTTDTITVSWQGSPGLVGGTQTYVISIDGDQTTGNSDPDLVTDGEYSKSGLTPGTLYTVQVSRDGGAIQDIDGQFATSKSLSVT